MERTNATTDIVDEPMMLDDEEATSAADGTELDDAGDETPVDPETSARIEGLLEQYAEFIYRFPMRVMGAPEDECAEFYTYAVTQIRRRQILAANKYVERENARFETWLAIVLKNLYIDLKRATREPRVDLSETIEATAASGEPTPGAELIPGDDEVAAEQALEALKPESRVLFKLLLLGDLALTDDDFAVLSERSGRTVAELKDLLRELEGQVAERAVKEQDRQVEMTRVFWWVEYYRDRLAHLLTVHGQEEAGWSPKAENEIREVRRKLAKRRRQHAELVRTYRAAGMTVKTSYDMIARVLNTTRDAVKMEAYRARHACADALDPMRNQAAC